MLPLPKWLRKFFARIGCPTLGLPPENCPESEKKKDELGLMVFHYCMQCRKYHWDHAVDWLSKNEHFLCGNCGTVYKSDHAFGFSFFYISECKRVAEENKKSFFLLIFFGFKKYYPDDRGGRTAAHLESITSIATFAAYLKPGPTDDFSD
jgi:hypothetical protein